MMEKVYKTPSVEYVSFEVYEQIMGDDDGQIGTSSHDSEPF